MVEALLKAPASLVAASGGDSRPGGLLRRLLLVATASIVVFGLVMGNFAMGVQLWSAPLKLLLGLAASTLICFPSLFIFGSLAGADLRLRPLASALGGFLALHGLLLLGFAPVVWVFTRSTDAVGFIGGLCLAVWLISIAFGFRFLREAIANAGGKNLHHVYVWFIIFLLVSLQMSTTLRPLLGRSDTLFTGEKKFFLTHWSETIDDTLTADGGIDQGASANWQRGGQNRSGTGAP